MHDHEQDKYGQVTSTSKEYHDAKKFNAYRSDGKCDEDPLILGVVKKGMFENIKIHAVQKPVIHHILARAAIQPLHSLIDRQYFGHASRYIDIGHPGRDHFHGPSVHVG